MMREVEGVLGVVLGWFANVAGDDLAIDSPEMVRKISTAAFFEFVGSGQGWRTGTDHGVIYPRTSAISATGAISTCNSTTRHGCVPMIIIGCGRTDLDRTIQFQLSIFPKLAVEALEDRVIGP